MHSISSCKLCLVLAMILANFCIYAQASEAEAINLGKEDVVKFGDNTGKISFKLTDGQKPFEYTWSQQKGELNGNGILNLVDREISIKDLPAGKYDLLITDANYDVMFDNVVIISAPVAEKIEISPPAISDNEQVQKPIAKPAVPIIEDFTDSSPRPAKRVDDYDPPKSTTQKPSSDQLLFSETIYFEADSTQIDESISQSLKNILDRIKIMDVHQIIIEGHTNGVRGIKDAYCKRLAQARCTTIKNYFESKGLSSNGLLTKNHGKRKPKASNNTKAGRTKNQRVEIKVLGKA